MSNYQPFGSDAEVYGGAMLAFNQSINFTDFQPILEKHHLTEIDPSCWYPQQIWLDVFNEIATNPNSSENLISIGMRIVNTASITPEIAALPFAQIMLGFGTGSYQANNRGKDIGCIETQLLDETHILMVDKTPYPDDFVYGAYYAMARRYLPPGTHFTVTYDEHMPRREQGGTATLVHITWELHPGRRYENLWAS